MKYIGVDFSISNPAICIERDDGSLEFFFVSGNKKICTEFWHEGVHVKGLYYSAANHAHSEIERFVTIAMLLAEQIPEVDSGVAGFESYAFGAKGRLLQLAEITGIFKGLVRSKGYRIETATPTEIKKFAIHGGADKLGMADAWFADKGWNIHDHLGTAKGESPAADVIDSYYALTTVRDKVLNPREPVVKKKKRRKKMGVDT